MIFNYYWYIFAYLSLFQNYCMHNMAVSIIENALQYLITLFIGYWLI